MEIWIPYAVAVAGLILGLVIGRLLQKNKANGIIKQSQAKARAIVKKARREGDDIKKNKIVQAKQRLIEMKGEHENVI